MDLFSKKGIASRELIVAKSYYIYIMANDRGVLYVGMTNDLERRVYQHKNKLVEGFTSKYNIDLLMYFEETSDVHAAIVREKEIKKWRRSKKLALIRTANPTFTDLSADWFEHAET